MLGAPDWALDEEMVTIRPHPASSMSGRAAWTQVNVPVRLTPMIRSHPSAVMSRTGVNDFDPGAGHQDLDRAKIRPDTVEPGVNRGPVGDVDVDGNGRGSLASQFVGRRLGRGSVAVDNGDTVAIGGEPPGNAEADSRSPTGDDGNPAHRSASAASNSRWRLVSPRRIQVGS